MAKRKTGVTILFSIIIAALIVIFTYFVINYVYEQPQYDRYCNVTAYPAKDIYTTQTTSEQQQLQQCNEEYTKALEDYNRNSFYIYALIGFALVAYGLTRKGKNDLGSQITGLSAGGVLAIMGAMRNSNSKLSVIIVTGVLIASLIYVAKKRKLF